MHCINSAWSWKNDQTILRDDWLNPCLNPNLNPKLDSYEQVIFGHIIYSETFPPTGITLKPTSTTYCGNYFNISKHPCFQTEPNLNWKYRNHSSRFPWKVMFEYQGKSTVILCKLWPTQYYL